MPRVPSFSSILFSASLKWLSQDYTVNSGEGLSGEAVWGLQLGFVLSLGWSSGDAQGSSAEPFLLSLGSSFTLTSVHRLLKMKITPKMLVSLEKRRLRVFSNLTDPVIL